MPSRQKFNWFWSKTYWNFEAALCHCWIPQQRTKIRFSQNLSLFHSFCKRGGILKPKWSSNLEVINDWRVASIHCYFKFQYFRKELKVCWKGLIILKCTKNRYCLPLLPKLDRIIQLGHMDCIIQHRSIHDIRKLYHRFHFHAAQISSL